MIQDVEQRRDHVHKVCAMALPGAVGPEIDEPCGDHLEQEREDEVVTEVPEHLQEHGPADQPQADVGILGRPLGGAVADRRRELGGPLRGARVVEEHRRVLAREEARLRAVHRQQVPGLEARAEVRPEAIQVRQPAEGGRHHWHWAAQPPQAWGLRP